MERKFLKDLGLEDAVIDSIMAEHGKVNGELATAKQTINSLEEQINERNQDIESLKSTATGNEELQTKYNDLLTKYETQKVETEQTLQAERVNNAIQLALKGKVKDPSDFDSLIDREQVTFKDDGSIDGLDTQLEALKENKSYLFVEDQPVAPELKIWGAQPKGTENTNPADPINRGEALAKQANERDNSAHVALDPWNT